jgi:chitinase
VGGTIRYTLDGTAPSASSAAYTGPVRLTSTSTLQARTYKDGYTESTVSSASFNVTQPPSVVATPTITSTGGSLGAPLVAMLATSTPGATIRYTTDMTMPNATSTAYSAPITINSSLTLHAKAFKSGMVDSAVASMNFVVTPPPTTPPPQPPPPTSDTRSPTVSIASPSTGATVRRTVLVRANASDNVGVVGVQFFVGSTPIGSEDTSAPFEVDWNTLTRENGGYYLSAVARDAAGNVTTSRRSFVRVNNR